MRGKAWKYGKNVDTDAIYPAKYLVYFEPDEVAKHVMEGLDPGFAQRIRPGDIVVAESNFGTGSAREQAATALKLAKVGAVVADSFNRTFYRNAVNSALPLLALDGISKEIKEGDDIEVDIAKGLVINHTSGKRWSTAPMPQLLIDIINHGGAVAYYRAKAGGR